jgi:hypothetical protein
MKQDYPKGEKITKSSIVAATDARPITDDSSVQYDKKVSLQNEPIISAEDQPKVVPHELTDRRDAVTSVSVNEDGTLTQKNYFTPKYYKQGNDWKDIDSSLIEDKNAGDAGNVFGKLIGQIQSWVSSPTNFIVRENDWQARFSPSGSQDGMVRIKKGNSQIGFSPVGAKDIAPVITTDADGKQTVHYYDLWPGVNVEYVVESAAVKENVIIKDKNASNSVSFKLTGCGQT